MTIRSSKFISLVLLLFFQFLFERKKPPILMVWFLTVLSDIFYYTKHHHQKYLSYYYLLYSTIYLYFCVCTRVFLCLFFIVIIIFTSWCDQEIARFRSQISSGHLFLCLPTVLCLTGLYFSTLLTSRQSVFFPSVLSIAITVCQPIYSCYIFSTPHFWVSK